MATTIFLAAVLAALALAVIHPRKTRLLSKHPLYGVQLHQDIWSELDHLIRTARMLPLSPKFQVAGLIQGEEDVSDKETALWASGADVYKLTFKTQRADALWFPKSLLAEGRNFLLAAAAINELQRGYRYTYYCFFDADVKAQNWGVGWKAFENFLQDWQPAVGLPVVQDYAGVIHENFITVMNYTWPRSAVRDEGGHQVRSVMNFDHPLEAVHSDASRWLLPYDTAMDHLCQWVSQWRFSSLANALFPSHVLLLSSLQIQNPHHSSYTKAFCLDYMRLVTEQLWKQFPPEVQSCFPEAMSQVVNVRGKYRHSAYLPWGTPLKRLEEAEEPWRQNYSRARTMREVRSCDDEPVAQALNAESIWSWCRGCDHAQAFAMLQVIVSQRMFDISGWIKMANFMAYAAANHEALGVAQVLLAIALRLIRCTSDVLPNNLAWHELEYFVRGFKSHGIHILQEKSTLDRIEATCLVDEAQIYRCVRAALSPAGPPGEFFAVWGKDESVRQLVEVLRSCVDNRILHGETMMR